MIEKVLVFLPEYPFTLHLVPKSGCSLYQSCRYDDYYAKKYHYVLRGIPCLATCPTLFYILCIRWDSLIHVHDAGLINEIIEEGYRGIKISPQNTQIHTTHTDAHTHAHAHDVKR
jgi:hypothetical protein